MKKLLVALLAMMAVLGVFAQEKGFELRLLNHWDNPDGTVERGYAGRSIWKWDRIPSGKGSIPKDLMDRYKEYGRYNQEIGINGTVLNNVNAKPMMLSTDMLKKTAKIADVLRPYGIKVYLSVNFASPKALGDCKTADPLDASVIKWWEKKAAEIYKLIPDFGGFLVKANSEGEPGPMDYGRTHVDGANMLAKALDKGFDGQRSKVKGQRSKVEGQRSKVEGQRSKVEGQRLMVKGQRLEADGPIVMWRAFVYSAKGGDRASQAVQEFLPYDGQFADNVIIQIKNGPIDFQPREPISPLFYNLKKTKMMVELQITQEYTGNSVQTCYLGTDWCRILKELSAVNLVGAAGVANIGDSENWTANDLARANWYAFGRLVSDRSCTARQAVEEFLKKEYTDDERFVKPMAQLMMKSHDAVVSYMMPYGLHHIFAGGHHYGPEPWCAPKGWREDWLPKYYHKADAVGLGFDRTTDNGTFSSAIENEPQRTTVDGQRSGSGNVDQYPEPLRTLYNNIELCPEEYLLWFHHVGWDYVMKNGLSLWENLCYKYDAGVREAESFVEVWKSMKPYVDETRYARQLTRFERQANDAWWWRDACLLYFQTFSKRPLPIDCPAPRHNLDDLMKFKINIDNYTAAPIDKLP